MVFLDQNQIHLVLEEYVQKVEQNLERLMLVRIINLLLMRMLNHFLHCLKYLDHSRLRMLKIQQLLIHLNRLLVGVVPYEPLFFEMHGQFADYLFV